MPEVSNPKDCIKSILPSIKFPIKTLCRNVVSPKYSDKLITTGIHSLSNKSSVPKGSSSHGSPMTPIPPPMRNSPINLMTQKENAKMKKATKVPHKG